MLLSILHFSNRINILGINMIACVIFVFVTVSSDLNTVSLHRRCSTLNYSMGSFCVELSVSRKVPLSFVPLKSVVSLPRKLFFIPYLSPSHPEKFLTSSPFVLISQHVAPLFKAVPSA